MDSTNFDLKDALRAGVSPEQMLRDFQLQLRKAQAEVASEQTAANIDLQEAREDMIDAVLTYLVALGIAPAEILEDEDLPKLYDAIKEVEDEFMAKKPFLDMLRSMAEAAPTGCPHKRDADDVINSFLKTLI